MNEIQVFKQNNNVLAKPNALQEAEDDLLEKIKKAILTCYFELNQAVPNEIDLTVICNKVLDVILEKYTSMRADEIAIAFSNGIRKQYGEYYGLCLISYEQFIEGYLNDPVRKEAIKRLYKANEVKAEPTDDEKFTTAKGLCMAAYEQVKFGKNIGITAGAVYTFLNSIGLIDPEYKKGIMPGALAELVKEKEIEIANCMQIITRRQLNEKLALLKQNIASDGINKEQYDECKRVARRIILTNWLRDIILNEVDLSELLESKRIYKVKK